MINRRTMLAATMTPLLFQRWGAPSFLVERSDLGMAAVYIDDMQPGDACAIRQGRVYWQGQPIGLAPSEAIEGAGYRILQAALDEAGKTRIIIGPGRY